MAEMWPSSGYGQPVLGPMMTLDVALVRSKVTSEPMSSLPLGPSSKTCPFQVSWPSGSRPIEAWPNGSFRSSVRKVVSDMSVTRPDVTEVGERARWRHLGGVLVQGLARETMLAEMS